MTEKNITCWTHMCTSAFYEPPWSFHCKRSSWVFHAGFWTCQATPAAVHASISICLKTMSRKVSAHANLATVAAVGVGAVSETYSSTRMVSAIATSNLTIVRTRGFGWLLVSKFSTRKRGVQVSRWSLCLPFRWLRASLKRTKTDYLSTVSTFRCVISVTRDSDGLWQMLFALYLKLWARSDTSNPN